MTADASMERYRLEPGEGGGPRLKVPYRGRRWGAKRRRGRPPPPPPCPGCRREPLYAELEPAW